MLFLQGTRNAPAERPEIKPACERLGPIATLKLIENADHSGPGQERAQGCGLPSMKRILGFLSLLDLGEVVDG